MRDEEFSEIYKKLVPKLDKYFHACLKNANYVGPYKDVKRDLINLTGHDVFLNSRKESLSNYCIEALIWTKARNIWYDFIKPQKSRTRDLDYLAGEKSPEPDALYQILVREQLERIKLKVDPETWKIIEMRADGFSYKEIAKTMNAEEGKIKMQMYRLRKRLEKQSLRFL